MTARAQTAIERRSIGATLRWYSSALAIAVSLAIGFGQVSAQPFYPMRPVRLIVGFGAGTPPDVAARVVANALSQLWNQPVIVENMPGASGNLAGVHVARAEHDGYTLLLAANSGIVINPVLFPTMPYDPLKDLVPVTMLYSYPNVLVASGTLGVRTVQELVALTREKPGALLYASTGVGTTTHLAGEMLKSKAGIDIRHVPYRGGNNLIVDIAAGRVHIYFGPTTSTLEQARLGTVRALAVTSPTRFPLAPDIPTMKESGFPNFTMTVWWGLMAPAGTPSTIIAKLHRDIAAVLASRAIRDQFASLSIEPVGTGPEDFSATIQAEIPLWSKAIKDAGIAPE